MPHADRKPLVIITGAAGDIGSSLTEALRSDYTVIGVDRSGSDDIIKMDLTSEQSVREGFHTIGERYGRRIAAFIHLAAYFDFTGEEHPLYEQVNVEGTRRLLRHLREFEVEQFSYASTMLVHRPGRLGELINEQTPLQPKWAYPRSKQRAEQVLREEHGDIPYVIFRFAGLYDDKTCVPTLAQQIARIYERNLQSRLYPGEMRSGQAFIHRDDMLDAFKRAVDRRHELPGEAVMLVGESDAVSFDELQNLIGKLVHGEEEWSTLQVPSALAKAGSWLQHKAEPIVPDAIDRGEAPFIRPFMIDMAEDHYALDITRARELLGWSPRHDIRSTLPRIIAALKHDPAAWYREHKISPPEWIETAEALDRNPHVLGKQHEISYRRDLAQNRWAHLCNIGLATWLITAPFILGYESAALTWSDVGSGVALAVFALLSLSHRAGWARWVCAAIGTWLLCAPVFFWAPTAAAYLNDTVVGMLVIGLAVLTRPMPGISPVAALGPTVPPGWDYSPSNWFQRLPIIALAFVGLHISRYLAAYQLGHVDAVWEPFFSGGPDPRNGTEEIITSSVSRAWPVSDAGVGAITYALEILTGVMGSSRRWRTMPWLVMLFGLMIVPLGVISLTFIIIQPIVIGTWCTLCLIAATAMLIQIPYSLDELVATAQFLRRRKRAGQSLLRVFFVGDTDEGPSTREQRDDDFERPLGVLLRDSVTGGIGMPWTLAASIAIGLWLMFTRITIGADGAMANADHLIGALVITVAVTALAEVARPVRFLNAGFGLALLITPFVLDAGSASMISSVICGLALIALSVPAGAIRHHYDTWNRLLV